MFFNQKYIRSIGGKIPESQLSSPIYLGVELSGDAVGKAVSICFPGLSEGESALPSVIGRFTRYNAEGKEVRRKDLPMETCYRQVEWTWTEMHGQDRVERSDIKDVPYKRYPRDFLPPPSVELFISSGNAVAGPFFGDKDSDRLIHGINLFLEIFGECRVLDENLKIPNIPTRKVPWKILPPGKKTWAEIETYIIEPLVARKPNERKVIEDRVKHIESKSPDFRALGEDGFSGYVIFGFEKLGLYICESVLRGNALYVFNEDWKTLSRKTKSEILEAKCMEERIVHYGDWKAKVDKLTSRR